MLGQLNSIDDPQAELVYSLPPAQREAAQKVIDLGGLVSFKETPDGCCVEAIGFGKNFSDAEIHLLWPFRNTPVFSFAFGNDAKINAGSITRVLHEFPKLRSLDISHKSLGDSSLRGLANLHELRSIRLQGRNFTSAALPLIGRHRDLNHLSLGETAVDDIGFAHLETLSKLEFFGLNDTNVTSVALRSIGKLTNLEIMTLRSTQIDDEGLKHLTELLRLRQLDLSGTKITNAGMVHVAKLADLEHLAVFNTKVNAEGVALLQKMPKLKDVDWVNHAKASLEQKRSHARFILDLPSNVDKWTDIRERLKRGDMRPVQK